MTKKNIPNGAHKAGWLKRGGIAVHLGSRIGNDPKFAQNTVALAQNLIKNGFKIAWYGDGDAGNMGVFGEAFIRFGGQLNGTSLDFFHAAQGDGLPGAFSSNAVPDMPTRMRMMRNGIKNIPGSNANIANPGSYGTMEEKYEWMLSKNPYLKPQVWVNLDGHWNGSKRFIDRMVAEGVEKPSIRDRFHIVSEAAEAASYLKELNKRKAQPENYELNQDPASYYLNETKHAIIVRNLAPLSVIGPLMSRIVTYDVSNIPGQTLFNEPNGIIKPAIFIGNYYEALQEQIYHIIGTGFSPDERRQFFHFVETEREAYEVARDLELKPPLTPEDFKKKHQEALPLEEQRVTHPTLDSLLPDSPT